MHFLEHHFQPYCRKTMIKIKVKIEIIYKVKNFESLET